MSYSVPKCKECEYHQYKSQNGWDKERHYCCEPSKLSIGSFIKTNEFKTSPQWCPIREAEKNMVEKQAERLINKFNNSLFLKYK